MNSQMETEKKKNARICCNQLISVNNCSSLCKNGDVVEIGAGRYRVNGNGIKGKIQSNHVVMELLKRNAINVCETNGLLID